MTRALKGLNKRTTDTAAGECYLTPRWAVEWLLERWTPSGLVICDPCACGFAGWSIGKMVASIAMVKRGSAWVTRDTELSDIDPQGEGIVKSDFRALSLPTGWPRTIISNPPYNLLPEFVRWALEHAQEVVVLTRFGFLCAENGRRAKNLRAYIQPAKRLAFELLPVEGQRRLEHNTELRRMVHVGELTEKEYGHRKFDVYVDPGTLTGYRMSATGVDHGWAVYQRDYTGRADLVIEAVGGDALEPAVDTPSAQLALL